MSRPAKASSLRSGHQTKKEAQDRRNAEKHFCNGKKPAVPKELTKDQKKIFKFILSNLPQELLCSLDGYILTIAAISIDRIYKLEFALNRAEEGDMSEMATVKLLGKHHEQYMRDFFRCCNELCLSPQSRAKIGSAAAAANAKKSDPLAEILKGLG